MTGRIEGISACGDFIYSNSPFGSSPALVWRLYSSPRGMCFSLWTSAAWSDLESLLSLCGWNLLHTNASRLVLSVAPDILNFYRNKKKRTCEYEKHPPVRLKVTCALCWLNVANMYFRGLALHRRVLPWSNCFWMLSWSVLFPLTRYRPSVVRPANTDHLQFNCARIHAKFKQGFTNIVLNVCRLANETRLCKTLYWDV